MEMEKEVLTLNLDDVLPNRFQPRIKFNEQNILELSDSIKEHGVIQPIVVRKIGDKYEIIAGERRYKASILAGKTTIPAIVTNLDDKNSAEIALIENVQRQDLTPIEEAVSYKKILDMGYLNQATLAEKLGKNQSTIANKLRLLNLDDEVKDALLDEKISERHARSLLKLQPSDQLKMLNRILTERLTVRKTDDEINKILNGEVENPDESSEGTQLQKEIIEPIAFEAPQAEPIKEEIEVLDFSENTVKENENMQEQINNEFGIPTQPIVEEVEAPVNQSIPPGFVDVDKIETEAKDIYPKPEIPIETLEQIPEESIVPIDPLAPVTPLEPVVEDKIEGNERPTSGNRFFTMFNTPEESNPNYVSDIESEEVNLSDVQPQPQTVFNFNPFIQDVKKEEEPIEEEKPQPTIQPNVLNPMAQPLTQTETEEFINPVNTYSLTDDEEFKQPEEMQQPTYQPEPVSPVPLEDTMNSMNPGEVVQVEEDSHLVDFKAVIGTIRDCSKIIEDFGYVIDTDELDFEDHYEVTFRIEK